MVCCVVDCPNKSNTSSGCRSYPFPKTSYKSSQILELARKRRIAWIRALRIVSANAEVLHEQKVCFLHFIAGRPAKLADVKNPDWIPSQKLGVGVNRVCEIAVKRSQKLLAKPIPADRPKSIPNEILEISDSESLGGDGNDYDEPNIEFVSVTSAPEVHSILGKDTKKLPQSNVKTMIIEPAVKTSKRLGVQDFTADNLNVINHDTNHVEDITTLIQNEKTLHKLQIELKNKDEIIEMYKKKETEKEIEHKKSINTYEEKLKECDIEIKKLKAIIRTNDISFNGLKSDDDKVKNLTGLPSFALLNKLYEVVKDELNENPKTKIKAFDSFVITLMKLRLDLPISYLSYIFGVTGLQMSRMYRENLSTMNAKIGPLVKWPDDDALLLSTPSCFKEIMGNKCIVLVHFLDILIKNLKPSRKGVQSMKHTIRYLIAFTPAGEIIYVSQGFGSSATNEGIIQESGFFDKISEQHIVLSVKDMFEEKQKDNEQIQSIKHMAKNTEDKVLDILKDNFRILFNRQSVNSNGEVYSEFTVRCCCALANLQMPELVEVETKEIAETVVVHTKPTANRTTIVVRGKEAEDELL